MRNRIRPFHLLICLPALLLFTCAKPKDQGTGLVNKIYTSTLEGRVVDKNGNGLSKITVTTRPGGKTTTSFPDGTFEISDLPADTNYTLFFSSYNYNDTIVGTFKLGRDDTLTIPAPVKLIYRYSTLAGTVFLDAGKTTQAQGTDVGVEVENQDVSATALTGNFRLSKVEPSVNNQPVRVIAVKGDKGFGFEERVVGPDTTIDHINIAIAYDGGSVTGTVSGTNPAAGVLGKKSTVPLMGVEVSAVGGVLHDITDKNGDYTLHHVPSMGCKIVLHFKINGKDTSIMSGVTAVEDSITSLPDMVIGASNSPLGGSFTLLPAGIAVPSSGIITPLVTVKPRIEGDTVKILRYYWDFNGIPGTDDSTKTNWVVIPENAFAWNAGETRRMVYVKARPSEGAMSDSVAITVVRHLPVPPALLIGMVTDKQGHSLMDVFVFRTGTGLSDTTGINGGYVLIANASFSGTDTLLFKKSGFEPLALPVSINAGVVQTVVLDTLVSPRILADPLDASIRDSSSATFSVAAGGSGLLYQWQKNDQDIKGANASSYTTPFMRVADSGSTFRCVVSNARGSVVSTRAILKVTTRPPLVMVEPKDAVVMERDSAQFYVSASGTAPLIYQWYTTNANNAIMPVPGATLPACRFGTTYSDSGRPYFCVITNAAGKDTSKTAILIVRRAPPLITHNPRDTSVYSGDAVVFTVAAVSSDTMTWQWQRTDTNLVTINIIRATSAKYSLAPNMMYHRMQFRCIVTNSAGSDTSLPARLSVIPAGIRQMKLIPAANKTFTAGGLIHVGTAGPTTVDTAHQVTFTRNYFMDSTEVTQSDFLALMGVNPSKNIKSTMNPVEQVTWFDAVLYCNARSRRDGLDTVYQYDAITGIPGNAVSALVNLKIVYAAGGYRLPTEAEFEYACHGGTTTKYWWGADTTGAGARVWSWNNSPYLTRAVASKIANGYGLSDISGNALEWCNDWLGMYRSAPQTDPTGPAAGTARVARGGSVAEEAFDPNFLPQYRASAAPGTISSAVGFRCVLPR